MRKKDFVTCRTVLWWMVFSGCAINCMLRVQLNLVMVAIVIPPPEVVMIGQCNRIASSNDSSPNNSLIVPHDYQNDTNEYQEMTTSYLFPWNEYEQGLALGSYFWIYILSQIPGGLLARKYGAKLVFGMGNLLATLLGSLLPTAMNYHLNALIIIRVIQGFFAGVAYPAVHDTAAKWIPENQRSRFVSAYLGGPVGIGLTYPMSALIINLLGWESVFYVGSFLGVIWYLAWYFLAFDTPMQHPRISEKERTYILNNLKTSVDYSGENKSVPWRKVFTSVPFLISLIGNWSATWGYYTLIMETPTYLAVVHGWTMNETGVLSGFPNFLTMIFGYFSAQFCDWLVKTEKMTMTNIRKLATFLSLGIPAIIIFGLSFSGCYSIIAIVLITVVFTMFGAISSGTLANLVDLSPNYASVLLGITGFVVNTSGFLSPLFVGLMLNNNQTLERWQLVFIITAIIMAIGSLCYQIWGTAEQQSWNNYQTMTSNDNTEIIDSKLKTKRKNLSIDEETVTLQ